MEPDVVESSESCIPPTHYYQLIRQIHAFEDMFVQETFEFLFSFAEKDPLRILIAVMPWSLIITAVCLVRARTDGPDSDSDSLPVSARLNIPAGESSSSWHDPSQTPAASGHSHGPSLRG